MNKDLLALIGETPLVEIRHLNPNPNVKILAKIESSNPGGSIKDRVAAAMIKAAEESGELTKDKIIIEATSGNTGVGLAMVAAVKGYRIKLIMPETASEERKMIMAAYGAELELTPATLQPMEPSNEPIAMLAKSRTLTCSWISTTTRHPSRLITTAPAVKYGNRQMARSRIVS